MTEASNRDPCCGPSAAPGCCNPGVESDSADGARTDHGNLDIEFLYLDLSVCERCRDTESALEDAIVEVARILELTGVETSVTKTHVTSEKQAVELGLLVSPTIRLNGRDMQMDFRESRCDSCGTLCDCEGGVSCREWEYRGRWYTSPPKGLIVESILREVYGGAAEDRVVPVRPGEAPDNLKRFFSARR